MNATWIDSWRLNSRRRHEALERAIGSRPGMRALELPTAVLRIRVAGHGAQTVVYVPDPPNTIEHCDRLLERLSAVARVVCIELPGFGFSLPARNFRFTVREQTATLRAALEALGWAPYTLAFPCVSAYAALLLASDHPALVRRVVLMQAPAWDEELRWARRVDRHRLISTPVLGQLVTALLPRRVARAWYRAALPREAPAETVRNFLDPALDALGHGGSFCLASAFQATFGADRPALGRVTQPTTVVWGTADRSHRRTAKESIREYAPHAEYHEWPACGHFPELEEPDRFAALVSG